MDEAGGDINMWCALSCHGHPRIWCIVSSPVLGWTCDIRHSLLIRFAVQMIRMTVPWGQVSSVANRPSMLTHWGRVTHICVGKLTIIGSDNGLSPGRRQAIIWTNAGILLIGPLGTNFSEILVEIYTFSFKKIHLKMSSGNGGHFVSASMS